jgi:trimeric autotransporter adhesin
MNLPITSLRARSVLGVFALGCCALCQISQAVSPPPDGGYPGGNTAEGTSALLSRTSGGYNTAVGLFSLLSLTDGNFNTGVGAGTLLSNTADLNTATGAGALLSNVTGSDNTANGAFALFSNTTGSYNTATGVNALSSNIEGLNNNAFGWGALLSNTTGVSNNALGVRALQNNTVGNENVAVGEFALLSNTTGDGNTAIGYKALFSNTVGLSNSAFGWGALASNTSSENTANGFSALASNTTGNRNTAIGSYALSNNTEGHDNVALGFGAGFNLTTGNNNVYIGDVGVQGDSSACRIASIFGQTSFSGIPVYIDSGNKLGTSTSSKRFKDDIKPMDQASEALLALKPVTFRYKKEIDAAGTQQFGLVAEEVEKVNPALVVLDKEGKPYSVRYDQVNAMLLNEFLKEHRKVEKLEAIAEAMNARLKKQETQLQKVNALLQVNKLTSQIAASNP